MKTRILSLLLPLLVLIAIHKLIVPLDNAELVAFYSDKLRNSLFTGFLTAGSFLFSLKTFIVVKMKENVYDNEKYKKRVAEQRKLNKDLTHYGPLKRLSSHLYYTVFAAILSSV